MEFITKRIHEIADVVGGGTPSTSNEDYWGGNIPWLSPADLTGYQSVFISHGEKFITPEGVRKSGTQKLPAGTVLFSSRAPIGYIAISQNEIYTNQGFKSLVCKSQEIDNLYLYYFLKLNLDYIKNFASGATFPELSANRFKNIKITYCKSIQEQQKIASILSAYDSYIENNRKRIKLLEQMAENLYKEWFVRFRFPGYETAEFEGGVPKGWGKGSVATFADIMSGGTPKTDIEGYYGGPIPFFTPKDASDDFFSCATLTTITEDGLNHCNSKYYPQNTITITARGTVGKVNFMGVPMAMNQSCFALKSKNHKSNIYLFFALREASSMMKKMATGGVFDTIILKTFEHISMLNPPVELLNEFDGVVSPIMNSLLILQHKNTLLTNQRDLLLPRLMSGKLSI